MQCLRRDNFLWGVRHTYTSMRLQTVDGDKPIAVLTAAGELGHSNTKMIEKVYGHVLRNRQRLPEVRYRPEEAQQETPVHA